MLNLVDTHCHLHFPDFDADREEVIRRAREAGVRFMVNVGTDPGTNAKAHALASLYDFMGYSVGLHPHSAHEADEAVFAELERQIVSTRPAAIGEIGLDYFKSEGEPETQKKVFRRMLALAKKHSLPVIIHSRNALDDTYAILSEASKEGVRGVMHCFSYDEEAMHKLSGLGFYISFTCNITFKNAGALLEAAKRTPLDRLLFETDSPYLSPRRGKRNEPMHVAELAVFLGEARGESPEKLADAATANAKKLFGFKG